MCDSCQYACNLPINDAPPHICNQRWQVESNNERWKGRTHQKHVHYHMVELCMAKHSLMSTRHQFASQEIPKTVR